MINPIADVIAGVIISPNPCNAPLIVCANTENIIVIALICNNRLPFVAFGNNNSNIGCENIIIPTVHGNPISMDISMENDILLLALSLSPFAMDEEIDGTNAVANAILNDNGNVISVSTFPLNIPYCDFACASVKNFLVLLLL